MQISKERVEEEPTSNVKCQHQYTTKPHIKTCRRGTGKEVLNSGQDLLYFALIPFANGCQIPLYETFQNEKYNK